MKNFTHVKTRNNLLTFAAVLTLGFSLCSTVHAQQWSDGFESYTANTWPPAWVADGNATDLATNYVDNSINAYAGSNALRLFGVIGGCWGALAYRNLVVSPPFVVELAIGNGTDVISGCNPDRGGLALRQGTSWTNPSRRFLYFRGNGDIESGGNTVNLGTYTTNIWYLVKVRYELPSPSTVKLSYWIDNIYMGSETLSAIPAEAQLNNLELTVYEGKAWFDGVDVSPYVAENLSVTPNNATICWAQNCNGNFNITSNVNWTAISNQSWLSLNPSSGSNNSPVTFTAATDNPSTSVRTATVTVSAPNVSDQIVIVTQEGKPDGIEEIASITNLSIYPNPNSGEFVIEMELNKPQEMEMELLNVIGQVIYKEGLGKISGSYQKQLDLNYLAKGIYTLKLISEEGTTTRKIILE